MPFEPIDLIKYVPAAARRVLEVADMPSALAEIARSRSPLSVITTVAPGNLPDATAFDCIALFSGGADTDGLARLFDEMLAGGQVLAAPDAAGDVPVDVEKLR